MSFTIGPYTFDGYVALAPMAGVTDRPFRQMCRALGASMTVSEMISSKAELRHTRKSLLRMDHFNEPEPIIVQIAGTEPQVMADAAIYQVQHGAHIIDINMGCPAKKVCKVDAGSALLKNEDKVEKILRAVVEAVAVPVTLKTRLGWDSDNKNILRIAQIAQDAGIQALSIHGRTRDQKYSGIAQYELIKKVKQQVNIPIIANGDIDSAKKAQQVMDFTDCDAIMVGRAAQQKPWIFKTLNAFLQHEQQLQEPSLKQQQQWLLSHLDNLYQFYGAEQGTRIARKHINWQRSNDPRFLHYKNDIMKTQSSTHQYQLVSDYFANLIQQQNHCMDAA